MMEDLPWTEVLIDIKLNNLKGIHRIQTVFKLGVLTYPKVKVCLIVKSRCLKMGSG
jgi:hypothetical protein